MADKSSDKVEVVSLYDLVDSTISLFRKDPKNKGIIFFLFPLSLTVEIKCRKRTIQEALHSILTLVVTGIRGSASMAVQIHIFDLTFITEVEISHPLPLLPVNEAEELKILSQVREAITCHGGKVVSENNSSEKIYRLLLSKDLDKSFPFTKG